MIDGAVYSPEGKVYIQHYMPTPKYVKVGQKEYVASAEHSVSILLADEEDVPALLGVRGGCCGGSRQIFYLAGEGAVRVWKTGDR